MFGKLRYKFVLYIKDKIDKHLMHKQVKYQKKYNKQLNFNTWYYQVVTSNKKFNLSFFKRLKMYKKGFKSDDYYLYHLDINSIDKYMSEVERWKTRNVNGIYNLLLDDKLVFYDFFKNMINTPCNLCLLDFGKYIPLTDKKSKSIKDLLDDHSKIVVKPVTSGGGAGVHIIEKKECNYYVNGINRDLKYIQMILKNNRFVVQTYIEQHQYSNNIFSKSANTIRVIMFRDNNDKIVIPYALHRFGSDASGYVDNVCSGGYFGLIDISTGKIGKITSYSGTDFYSLHPDTKAKVEGISVPHWNSVKRELSNVMQDIPYIKFIAWDVLITEKDFCVIEANASTGLGILQVFEPLKNTELGNFYENNW